MKKVLFIAAIAVVAAVGLSSCKKCVNCEWKYNGATYLTYPEQCGTSSDIDTWKNTVNNAMTGTGYEFVCDK
jgi:hypothetical protein